MNEAEIRDWSAATQIHRLCDTFCARKGCSYAGGEEPCINVASNMPEGEQYSKQLDKCPNLMRSVVLTVIGWDATKKRGGGFAVSPKFVEPATKGEDASDLALFAWCTPDNLAKAEKKAAVYQQALKDACAA